MISNPIIISILISIGVSLVIAIVVTILMLRFFSKSDTDCLSSLVEQSVQRVFEKRWNDYTPQKDNSLQKKVPEKDNFPIEMVQRICQEEVMKAVHQLEHKMDKTADKGKKLSKKEKLEAKITEKEEQITNVKPEGIVITNLSVSEGKLVEVTGNQPSYYRVWDHKGQKYYEFYCDEARLKKAMYNRAAIIDPYCDKDLDSVDPDEASCIETIDYGLLDSENNIIKKTKIKYNN
jgi:hypothetical protein